MKRDAEHTGEIWEYSTNSQRNHKKDPMRGITTALKSGFFKDGSKSKLLKEIRKCDICPLGEKEEEIVIRGNFVKRKIPPKCPHYKPASVDCPISNKEMVYRLKVWFEAQQKGEVEMQRALIQEQISNGLIARDVELLTKGMPGYWTKEYIGQAMEYNDRLIKHQEGELHKHQLDGELTIKDFFDKVIDVKANESKMVTLDFNKQKEEEEKDEKS
jgi:hypothetical protein